MNAIFLNLAKYHELETQARLLYSSIQHRKPLDRDKKKYEDLMNELNSLRTEMTNGRLTLLHSKGISEIELKLLSVNRILNKKSESEWGQVA